MTIKLPAGTKAVKVRMLSNAPYGDENLIKGKEIEVSVGQADAWEARKLAERLESKPTKAKA